MKASDLINTCKASDFNTKHYEGIHIFNRINGKPVIVMRSKRYDPCNWCIVTGFNSIYFRTYNEAISYCKSRGFVK